MRALVTGGAGFIGSHLVRAPLRRGREPTRDVGWRPRLDLAAGLAQTLQRRP